MRPARSSGDRVTPAILPPDGGVGNCSPVREVDASLASRRTGCTVIAILGESEPIKTAFLETSFPIQP